MIPSLRPTLCPLVRGVVPQGFLVGCPLGSASQFARPESDGLSASDKGCGLVEVFLPTSFYSSAGLLCACLPWLSASRRFHSTPSSTSTATTSIPGSSTPLRMAGGISQKVSPDEVLPLLARDVATKGYQTLLM